MSKANNVFPACVATIVFSSFVGLLPPYVLSEQRSEDQSPAIVEVVRRTDGSMLVRNGKPYLIRGVGGTSNLQLLASIGFAFVVAGQGKPIRFFLDDVRFIK